MSQLKVDNNQFELIETPNKKRKRNENHPFTSRNINITSSTPIQSKEEYNKKVAFENPSFNLNSNKENNFMFTDSCMEVKSISDLQRAENIYEVVRKPPKKKKKNDFEDSCFVNPALNLNAQEHSINPFEVKRCPDDTIITKSPEKLKCFINSALDMKLLDSEKEVLNPFEVKRSDSINRGVNPIADIGGVTNDAFKELPTYTLAVPFTPSINRRINFADVDLKELTPCKMLATQLVFTPENSSKATANKLSVLKNKSLSVISEEALDIGEELDCYQLELENSINEAKVKRNGNRKNITNLSLKFSTLEEEVEENKEEPEKLLNSQNENATYTVVTTEETFRIEEEIVTKTIENLPKNKSTDGVEFEEVDDEDEEELFKNPAPFQRTYRRSIRLQKETDEKSGSDGDFKVPGHKNTGIKEVIRRSFRKIIHPNSNGGTESIPNQGKDHHGLLSSIRHSFRRKNKNNADILNTDSLNTTIVDGAPRQVFRAPVDEKLMEPSSFTKRGAFSRNSIRRTTKALNTFFQKTAEDYNVD